MRGIPYPIGGLKTSIVLNLLNTPSLTPETSELKEGWYRTASGELSQSRQQAIVTRMIEAARQHREGLRGCGVSAERRG